MQLVVAPLSRSPNQPDHAPTGRLPEATMHVALTTRAMPRHYQASRSRDAVLVHVAVIRTGWGAAA